MNRDSQDQCDLSRMKVMITGGLGFLGSSLAARCVAEGAEVLVVDALIDGCGGNPFNIETIKDSLRYDVTDVRDAHAMKQLVRGQDIVFHMAGQVSHVQGMEDPHPDLDVNVRGTMVLLEAVRRYNPGARLVAASTRSVYAPDVSLPVREDAPTQPTGIYEWSKLSAEHLIRLYHDLHDLDTVVLRLSNIYGPRGQMARPGAGIANWFCRLAIENRTLKVFGDGSLKRDFLYIEDAVDAMIALAIGSGACGQVVNLGHDSSTSLKDLAEEACNVAEGGRLEFEPFPREWAVQKPRDYVPNLDKIHQLVGWKPSTPLREGLENTIGYYREYRHQYW